MIDDIHSRSRLAGYVPEILAAVRVLIVGVGALGQNLALNLALAGVGELDIVDFDVFEGHNVTRSPLYPTEEEQRLWGKEKARIVARKLRPMMTASSPRMRYAVAPIQALGDIPLLHAQLVFSAVDNQNARAYLAERCHVVGRPLVEGGFFAEHLNVSVFGPGADDPCYRCMSPEKEGAFSCADNALRIEAQHAIPAIQNTAAVLAGLQAEIGIQWLHGDRSMLNQRVYMDIRAMSMEKVALSSSETCPGIHRSYAHTSPRMLAVKGHDTLAYLAETVERECDGVAEIYFPDDIVVRNYCTSCRRLVDARVPTWCWLASPLCIACGGSFQLAREGDQPASKASIYTDEGEEDIMSLTCTQVGLPAGTLCEILPDTDTMYPPGRYLIQLQGTIDDLMEEVF